MKTFVAKPATIEKKWYVVDAPGQMLGRLATVVADPCAASTRPSYTPHIDTGDRVVVVNADKVVVTGQEARAEDLLPPHGSSRRTQGRSYRHSSVRRPDHVVRSAVRGMLPHNHLGRAQLKKLKIYAGAEHPHAAQRPEALQIPAERE